MTNYTISIPDALYEKARLLAEQSAQSVDEIIRERLTEAFDQAALDLPVDERAELKAMTYLSDDTLWTIAREQMQPAKQEQMSLLMDKNSLGTITGEEYAELTTLVESGQSLTLRKAEAMKLLLDRGYQIGLEDLKTVNE